MTQNILVLCTHNSARSVLAEAMINQWSRWLGKEVQAFSAGSAPSGRVNPHALAVLNEAGIDTRGVRSKSWDEFAGPLAPKMRMVITVCDNAAAETCPIWPGSPVMVHWGYADPSQAAEAERRSAFEVTRQAIGYRVLQLLALPIESLSDEMLKRELTTIAGR